MWNHTIGSSVNLFSFLSVPASPPPRLPFPSGLASSHAVKFGCFQHIRVLRRATRTVSSSVLTSMTQILRLQDPVHSDLTIIVSLQSPMGFWCNAARRLFTSGSSSPLTGMQGRIYILIGAARGDFKIAVEQTPHRCVAHYIRVAHSLTMPIVPNHFDAHREYPHSAVATAIPFYPSSLQFRGGATGQFLAVAACVCAGSRVGLATERAITYTTRAPSHATLQW